jgi:membrane protein YqaA with SNARE-associated domain
MSLLNEFTQLFMGLANWAAQLGYLGAFFMGFLSSFTLFLPTPAFALIFVMAAGGLNPIVLGVAAGLGSAVGELIGFGVGYGSRQLLVKKHKKDLNRIEKLFQKYKGWLVIFVFAATPLPFDLVGIFCGNVGYPFKKFMIPTVAGKIVKYLAIALAGFYGVQWFSSIFVIE